MKDIRYTGYEIHMGETVPEFEMNTEKMMTCWIKRVRNLYQLFVFAETDTSDEYNLFLGQVRPYGDLVRYDVWIDTDNEPTVRIEKDDVVVWTQLEEPDEVKYGDIWIDVNVEG